MIEFQFADLMAAFDPFLPLSAAPNFDPGVG
jgi:hypothetical protein